MVIHGWGMNSSAWGSIAEQLEQYFRVTWVDLPGHGINHHVEANSIEEIVEVILPEIKQGTHLMGWSLGGLVAQQVIKQKPSLINKLVMVASTPRFSQNKDWQYAMPMDVLSAFSDNLQRDIKGTIKRFIALQFMGVKGSQAIQHELRSAILSHLPNENALKTGLKVLQEQDYRDLAMQQKQLWLLGEKDRLIPVGIEADLKALYPDATVNVMKGAGHAPFMTEPRLFANFVIDFLS